MAGTTNTYSNNRPGTDRFQDMMYNSVMQLRPPQTTSPNYQNNAMFAPSMLSRRAAGGQGYVPTIGASASMQLNEQPMGAPSGVPGSVAGLPPGIQQIFGGMASGVATPRTPTGGGGYSPGPNAIPTGRTAVPAGTAAAGGIPGILAMLQGMFAGLPNGPPGTAIAGLPTYDTAFSPNASTYAPTLGQLTRRPGETDRDFLARSNSFNSEQGQFADVMRAIQNSSAGSMGGQIVDPNAYKINTPTISREGTETFSADRIAQDVSGADSMFTRNILPAYNNLFNDVNAMTAAAAKESSGNLTGSGYANTMATALNRNASSQQALLADTLNQLVSQEIGRQGAGAQLAASRNTAQAGMDLTAQTTSAQLRQAADQLRVQAQQSGRSDLMQMAQVLNQRAMTQAAMEQQVGLANAGWEQEANLFNAGQENAANSQFFQAGTQRNQRQAEMDAAREMAIFGQAGQAGQFNAQQMMQLFQMMFSGGQPVSNQTSGGFGNMLPGLMQLLAAFI